jgi:hypothetical protein
MNNFNKIIESVKRDEFIHIMMLNTSKEDILKCSLVELAEIINTKMDKNPCNYYCSNCGQKGVPYSICKQNIIQYLNS